MSAFVELILQKRNRGSKNTGSTGVSTSFPKKGKGLLPRDLHRHIDGGSSNNSIWDTKENDTHVIACYYQSHLWKPKTTPDLKSVLKPGACIWVLKNMSKIKNTSSQIHQVTQGTLFLINPNTTENVRESFKTNKTYS